MLLWRFIMWLLLLFWLLVGVVRFSFSWQETPTSLIISNSKADSIINEAMKYLDVREAKKNRGIEIDKWNSNAGVPLGSPYCASFVYYVLDQCKIKYNTKKSGLARSLVSKTNSFSFIDVINKKRKILKSDILIWKKGKTISGHTGFAIEDWNWTSGKTIEANTGNDGGDGVYIKKRRIEPYNYFRINWITRYGY